MKVLGNTTPWNPHTQLNIYLRTLRGASGSSTSLWLHECPGRGRSNRSIKKEIEYDLFRGISALSWEEIALSTKKTEINFLMKAFLCSAWKASVCLHQYLPPKPHEWGISIGLLLFVGVKRIFFPKSGLLKAPSEMSIWAVMIMYTRSVSESPPNQRDAAITFSQVTTRDKCSLTVTTYSTRSLWAKTCFILHDCCLAFEPIVPVV